MLSVLFYQVIQEQRAQFGEERRRLELEAEASAAPRSVQKIPTFSYHLGETGMIVASVADTDPHVFGPPGSGSTSQRHGSGSFYHHAKIVRKTLIPTIL